MENRLDTLSEEQRSLITRHLSMVIEANERINLTRIDTIEEGYLLHVEDSLSALPEMEDSPSGLYGDMGSGAGFPGVPLAVATGRETVLIDSRKKKMDVVSEILEELDLSNQIRVYSGRAELLARSQGSQFSVLTARALSKLSVLMELASPLLKPGGHLICFKSHVDESELEHAMELQETVGMKHVSDRTFVLGEEYERRILVFEKSGKPRIKLPRLEGQAQKNPL